MSSKKDVYAAMFRKKNLATFNVSPKAAESFLPGKVHQEKARREQ